jgi:hypothetical protein
MFKLDLNKALDPLFQKGLWFLYMALGAKFSDRLSGVEAGECHRRFG